MSRKDYKSHESWGSVGFFRKSGPGRQMFGSAVKSPSTVSLEIKRCEHARDLHHNWYYPTDLLVEVEITPSQFAQLLTSMNVGEGVPCTIRYLREDGKTKRMEDPPVDRVETEKVQSEFKDRLKSIDTLFQTYTMQMEEIFKKKRIGVDDKKVLKRLVFQLHQEFQSNLPWTMNCFNEGADKIVAEAKAEVDAFITQAVQKTGLKSLEQISTSLLPSKNICKKCGEEIKKGKVVYYKGSSQQCCDDCYEGDRISGQ